MKRVGPQPQYLKLMLNCRSAWLSTNSVMITLVGVTDFTLQYPPAGALIQEWHRPARSTQTTYGGTRQNTTLVTMWKILSECHRKGQKNNPLFTTGNVMHSFPSTSLLIHDSKSSCHPVLYKQVLLYASVTFLKK
jgi:hypothetical protein